jgi:hypothetical protein
MKKINFIFGARNFRETPKPFESELFTLNVKGVLLTVIFKSGREKLFIDLSKLVRIDFSKLDPNWICIYVIGKRDQRVKELQFDCKNKATETKEQIIRLHKEATKCGVKETKDPFTRQSYRSYGWGTSQLINSWKHNCYLCARENEGKLFEPTLATLPRLDTYIESQIKHFKENARTNDYNPYSFI